MKQDNILNILINLAIANTVKTYSELRELVFNCYNDIESIVKLREVVSINHFIIALNWLYKQRWNNHLNERVYPEVKKHILVFKDN